MFKLINYSSKLQLLGSTATERTYKCPVCHGKLKLRLETGAYCCFTSNCNPNDIRTKLGAGVSSGKIYTFTTRLTVEPIEFSMTHDLARVDDYQLAKFRSFNDRKLTSYIFNDKAKVERVDYYDGRKKECYPKYMTGNTWVYGGNNIFGLYNDKYLNNKSTILIAEGEKTADIISYATKYLCLSPPTFGWTRDYLITKLIDLPVTSIIYLPDNDIAGDNKAKLVQRTCWSLGIPCSIYSYQDVFIDAGEDMIDLYNKEINITKLIEDYVNRIR